MVMNSHQRHTGVLCVLLSILIVGLAHPSDDSVLLKIWEGLSVKVPTTWKLKDSSFPAIEKNISLAQGEIDLQANLKNRHVSLRHTTRDGFLDLDFSWSREAVAMSQQQLRSASQEQLEEIYEQERISVRKAAKSMNVSLNGFGQFDRKEVDALSSIVYTYFIDDADVNFTNRVSIFPFKDRELRVELKWSPASIEGDVRSEVINLLASIKVDSAMSPNMKILDDVGGRNKRTLETSNLETKSHDIAISLGETQINLPAPYGYTRLDGRNAKFDQLLRTSVVTTNKHLATFGGEADLIEILSGSLPKSGRMLYAHASNTQMANDISSADFKGIKEKFREFKGESWLPPADMLKRIEGDLSSFTSQQLRVEIGVKIAPIVSLGIFNEDEKSIAQTSILKGNSWLSSEGSEKAMNVVFVVANSTIWVKNRLIYAYCASEFRTKADIDWTRSEVLKWRDAIVAANMSANDLRAIEPPATKAFGGAIKLPPPSNKEQMNHLPTDRRLTSGVLLVNRFAGENRHGKLEVINGLSEDALVKLISNGRLVASFYVRGGETFTLTNIPDGSYSLLYGIGFGWNQQKRDFSRGRHASRHDKTLQFATQERVEGRQIITSTSIISLTLHKVVSGNTTTSEVSLEEFENYD
jgi:hypothetical protein